MSQPRLPFMISMVANDLLALQREGLEPADVVGWGVVLSLVFQHMDPRTLEVAGIGMAIARARQQCFERMAVQAKDIGADGVVGIETFVQLLPGGGDQGTRVQVRASGSAVGCPGRSTSDSGPFMTQLSGCRAAQLISAGCRPVDSVYGLCVHVPVNQHMSMASQSGPTISFRGQGSTSFTGVREDLSSVTRAQRDLAVDRMLRMALASNADGVIAIEIARERLDVWISETQSMELVMTSATGSSLCGPTFTPDVGFVMTLRDKAQDNVDLNDDEGPAPR